MAKSAALNPTSMPFFPGGIRAGDDERGPSLANISPALNQEADRLSLSSLSISPTEYRSVRSSPIPSFNIDNTNGSQNGGIRFQQSPPGPDWMQESPTPRSYDSDRAFLPNQPRLARELSISSSVDTFSSADDKFSSAFGDETFIPATAVPMLRHGSAANIRNASRSPYPAQVVVTSSSPVSSLDSGSQPASSIGLDHLSNSEAQLRSSPLINEIIERVSRNELTAKEIQKDLNALHIKLDLLVDRMLNNHASQSPAQPLSQPEFKNPFAPSTPSIPINGSRPSLSLAPNQSSEDISQISQRLNTLTNSVTQLVALQTHQHIQTNGLLNGSPLATLSSPQIDLAPNQTLPGMPGMPGTSPNIIGHGLPNRPDLRGPSRTPNPPARTWSAGSLDLPVRPPDGTSPLGRPDVLSRDKRRSVSNLMRRDSAGVDVLGGSRDPAGPALSKWDQLALAPELLHSLTKFGVGPPNKIQQRALPFLLRGADIIAQAPPTQERIAAYVIPAIHVALVNTTGRPAPRGPIVVMVSTTVDQATQAQRMIRDLGGPIGIRSALGVGSPSAGADLTQELRLLQQNMPHIICGTPQKLHALFTAPQGGLNGSQVRLLVIDEVDQLIARNLHDFLFNIVKLLPPPRSRPLGSLTSPSQTSLSSMDSNGSLNPPPFGANGRRFSGISSSPNPSEGLAGPGPATIERQTALFSNTVPQDVLNLATAIQLKEPVRVLVRRDGNVTHADTNQGARGLRQFYLYLALTAGGRSDSVSSNNPNGLGIIGSGRGSTSAETVQAREWKLDALSDLFDDIEVGQAIVHVGGMAALDAVVYKLASRGLETIPMHSDMNAPNKMTALNKFRGTAPGLMRPLTSKVLVVYDVQIKTPEVSHVPLIINYDLPKAVEEYAHRVAPAIAPTNARAGVVVNFVTATGGDVEMLRSIECFYKIKCPEVPMSLRDIV